MEGMNYSNSLKPAIRILKKRRLKIKVTNPPLPETGN
jgi:hypothetical protein